jgi:hypothetical protein
MFLQLVVFGPHDVMVEPKVTIFPCCLTDDRALFARVPNSQFIQGLLFEDLYIICELCSLILP